MLILPSIFRKSEPGLTILENELAEAGALREAGHVKTYGQYCPIARTSEILAERWTPIIVRNLLAGCSTFTQLRAGAPGIPKALLADRLATLERMSIIATTPNPRGRGFIYSLTERGRELERVTTAMGDWGMRWLELAPHHLDPAYVLWATSKLIATTDAPEGGLVVRIILAGIRERYWILVRQPEAELCSAYPGRDEDLLLETDTETLVEWNNRRVTLADARRAGRWRISGRPALAKRFESWLRPSPFADGR